MGIVANNYNRLEKCFMRTMTVGGELAAFLEASVSNYTHLHELQAMQVTPAVFCHSGPWGDLTAIHDLALELQFPGLQTVFGGKELSRSSAALASSAAERQVGGKGAVTHHRLHVASHASPLHLHVSPPQTSAYLSELSHTPAL